MKSRHFCLSIVQPTCLIVVPNAVNWLDRFVTRDEVGVLGKIQAICERRGQQALAAGRKEGTAHG